MEACEPYEEGALVSIFPAALRTSSAAVDGTKFCCGRLTWFLHMQRLRACTRTPQRSNSFGNVPPPTEVGLQLFAPCSCAEEQPVRRAPGPNHQPSLCRYVVSDTLSGWGSGLGIRGFVIINPCLQLDVQA